MTTEEARALARQTWGKTGTVDILREGGQRQPGPRGARRTVTYRVGKDGEWLGTSAHGWHRAFEAAGVKE